MAVITISRQLGSLGSQVAKRLSDDLGSLFLDKQLLEEAFFEYGISKESVERFDERKPAFWELFKTDKARYLHFMKGAIQDYARKGNCVILGRGGQVLLGGLPGILHVRVIAPMEVRIQRIMERFECDERHAEKIINHSDYERTGYHKFFFDQDWEDLNLYDLVINTGSFSVDTTATIIEDATRTNEFKVAEKQTQFKLMDLALEHDVKTRIFYKEKIFVQFFEVEAHEGIVTLRGIVDRNDDREHCKELTAQIEGVKDVKNEIYYSPLTAAYGLHY